MNSIRGSGSRVRLLLLLSLLLCAAIGVPTASAQNAGLSIPEAARFLEHSTWGVSPDQLGYLQSVGYERFLEEQFEAPVSSYASQPLYPNTRPADCSDVCARWHYSMYPIQRRFFENALYGRDQLRQRVAFALHQIFVVSGVEITRPAWMIPYLQILDRNAFGNFRQLMFEITLNPAMGNYLDMAGNRKTAPNENYAREILQLFTIGLTQLAPDGTPLNGQSTPTYDQATVTEFARVFTGWNRAANVAADTPDYISPMVATQANHDTDPKVLLRGVRLPANQTALKDLNDALDNIFLDPSVGPFIGKQLIQHLVTSNPSPAYVSRITAVFNDNGVGVRGDLKAVVKAILLDPEASGANNNHLKHPLFYMTSLLRAFNATSADGLSWSDGYLNPQAANMGMDVYRPPSVFSYFSPAGGVPGTTLRGPEFGTLNTSTALQRVNFANTIIFGRIAANTTTTPDGTALNFNWVLGQAGNPEALVGSLNAVMLRGEMSADMFDAIVAAVKAIPATSSANLLKRVRTAAYLIATSPQFQISR